MISIRSVTSVRTVSTKRSEKAFARGLRDGTFTTSTPDVARTASNDAVNCPARSRIRNRNPAARSPRSGRRFRACCGPGSVRVRGDAEDADVP